METHTLKKEIRGRKVLRFTFRKYERISKKREIDEVLKKGEKNFLNGLIVYIYRKEFQQCSRLAVLVSSKIEKRAVLRNKFKRRIREIFRLNKHKIVSPIDIVVIATKISVKQKFKVLQDNFIKILSQKNLLK